MKVLYDTSLAVAGIGIVPWSRLGPEKWFSEYTIGSLHSWDTVVPDAPKVFSLLGQFPEESLEKQNTPRLLENEHFQTLLSQNLDTGTGILTYKPVEIPAPLQTFNFLYGDLDLSQQLENKVEFRKLMEPIGVPVPEFRVYDRSTLTYSIIQPLLNKWSKLVLQDELLSGGKGTFMINGEADFQYALKALSRISQNKRVVVSRMVSDAHERSVQAVVTRHGVFVGPLQKQIIADPLLANLSVADGDRFCGAEIGTEDVYADSYPEIKRLTLQIGKKIQAMGYKGIFGVDCLVREDGAVYVLEINPRITGITPLLTMLYRKDEDIPFYLLHILEMMNQSYEITDRSSNPFPSKGSLLVLHAHNQETQKINETLSSGVYNNVDLSYVRPSLSLGGVEPTEVLVQQYMPKGIALKPGGRMITAYIPDAVLDQQDKLTDSTRHTIGKIKEYVRLKPVDNA